jgi:hypothetical protein
MPLHDTLDLYTNVDDDEFRERAHRYLVCKHLCHIKTITWICTGAVFRHFLPSTLTGAAFAISVGIIALCIVAAVMKKSTQLILFEIHFLQELKSDYWTQFDIGYYSTLGLIVALNLLFMGTLILMIYGVTTVHTELLCPAMLICLLLFGVCLGRWVCRF